MAEFSARVSADEERLWMYLLFYEGECFKTARGLEFTYTVKGNEIFVSRKDKSITRSTINAAYRRAKEILAAGGTVDGPKKLGTFGASYLYPIFQHIGVIPFVEKPVQLKMKI